jgi:hypothetical protein
VVDCIKQCANPFSTISGLELCLWLILTCLVSFAAISFKILKVRKIVTLFCYGSCALETILDETVFADNFNWAILMSYAVVSCCYVLAVGIQIPHVRDYSVAIVNQMVVFCLLVVSVLAKLSLFVVVVPCYISGVLFDCPAGFSGAFEIAVRHFRNLK